MNKTTIKHREISAALKNAIVSGRHRAGDRLPSEEALCRRWQVSRPTVRRALRDLLQSGLVDIRAGSGCYVSAGLRVTRPVIALLADGLGKTEILDPICAEISRAAHDAGCTVLNTPLTVAGADGDLAKTLVARNVSGVIFAPLEHGADRERRNRDLLDAFRRAGAAVVLADRDTAEFPARSDCDVVALDNFHAGYLLGRHLTVSGARRVVFVAKPNYPSSTDLRLAGLQNGLLRHGGRKPEFKVGDPRDVAFVKSLRAARQGFDAVVCSNDLTAAQFLQAATNSGWRVPEDFLLAGFDDVSYASLLSTPLTTIRQPCADIGSVCVRTLLERLRHPQLPPRTILLTGELVVRASTTRVVLRV
ncbi:MAG: GntR family transcriptional regulator [Verrucomicrobiales bacterium]|nr:GntR family transcriptional regulator [Verrucomicrobiales bacterium]